MVNGVVQERSEGTPQGGPLSPLLANVLLDEVDKELEKRGHAFARYADDCNVYVRSRRAGERVMQGLRRLYEGLHLRINETKSAVGNAKMRTFLGYGIWRRRREVMLRVDPKAIAAMKDRVREITARSRGWSMKAVVGELRSYLIGWKQYFRLAYTPRVFPWPGRLDPPTTASAAAQALETGANGIPGASEAWCFRLLVTHGRILDPAHVLDGAHARPSRIARPPLRPTRSPSPGSLTSTFRTARCGPACRVVWEGLREGSPRGPYPDRPRGIAPPPAKRLAAV